MLETSGLNADAMLEDVVEGVGNEVFYGLILGSAVAVVLAYVAWHLSRSAIVFIDPSQLPLVEEVRRRLFGSEDDQSNSANGFSDAHRPANARVYSSDDQCPVCLNIARLPVTTNCGHRFCGQCIVTYWRYGTWLGAIACPVCRSQVTVVLRASQDADADTPEKRQILHDLRDYNRRFSGAPRPLIDYIRDIPVLLPHLAVRLFSWDGVMIMFRLRVILCLCAAVAYVLSPLDILPEAVFGLFGLLDDLFILFLFAIYTTFAYRNFLAAS